MWVALVLRENNANTKIKICLIRFNVTQSYAKLSKINNLKVKIYFSSKVLFIIGCFLTEMVIEVLSDKINSLFIHSSM